MKLGSCLLVTLLAMSQVLPGKFMASDLIEDVRPASMVTIGDYSYFFGPPSVYLSLEDAMVTCNDLGMKLVSFDNQVKYEGVRDYMELNGYNSSTWTSGRTYSQGKWFWSGTGRPFDFTAWAEGEPEIMFSCFPCMIFSWFSEGWSDSDCVEKLMYICEV